MRKYSIKILTSAVCRILNVDPIEAFEKVAWSDETRSKAHLGVDGSEYIALGHVIMELAGESIDLFALGCAMAHGLIIPIFLAFASAPNLDEGLRRLSRYKTLFGPITLHTSEVSGRLRLEIIADNIDLDLPACMALPVGVFIYEKARIHSARVLSPYSVTVPYDVDQQQSEQFFGVSAKVGQHFSIEFSPTDRYAPFISENNTLWEELERDLERQLNERDNSQTFSVTVEHTIRKLLNYGPFRADNLCEHLGISRSTLQRKLNKEQKKYKDILQSVRLSLAKRYLSGTILQLSEISSLVGFSDSKSFHRAFKDWTGETPEQFRKKS